VTIEPYDYASWCLILVFSVHASGAAIFVVEWLSPEGLDQGNKPITGDICALHDLDLDGNVMSSVTWQRDSL